MEVIKSQERQGLPLHYQSQLSEPDEEEKVPLHEMTLGYTQQQADILNSSVSSTQSKARANKGSLAVSIPFMQKGLTLKETQQS
mmetsp:Transcript_14406/g.14016  ORF Transcript_14406/g.14016 Transcript_14406/m.14016 type:complete len:84 (-) Transcript_14406:323-574(-)